MKSKARFDDSLPLFVNAVVSVLGSDAFDNARVIRDSYGRLTLLTSEDLKPPMTKKLIQVLRQKLGSYVSAETAIIGPSDFGATSLWSASALWRLIELSSGEQIWLDLVDKRIVGQDWTVSPTEETDPFPPRLIFGSMKGGVGRSTALCILAVHLAQMGQNVLVIDADLEAPGLGSLLLDQENRPRYGLIDYLVENGIGGWESEEFDLFRGLSFLTDQASGQGLVHVVPAIGQSTLDHPVEMLAKLSRALLEDPTEGRAPKTVREQFRDFLDIASARHNYDAILIDSRAGLSEISGSTLLGLGARILFFGINQQQTFEDYRFLLSHLAHLPAPSNCQQDWRRRIRFVHSKADPQGDDVSSFQDRLYELVATEFYEEDEGDGNSFVYSLDDKQAPHAPLVINFDFPFMRFDPLKNPGQLKRETYQAAFAEFLRGALAMLQLEEL